jgi:hypothetical protein
VENDELDWAGEGFDFIPSAATMQEPGENLDAAA